MEPNLGSIIFYVRTVIESTTILLEGASENLFAMYYIGTSLGFNVFLEMPIIKWLYLP